VPSCTAKAASAIGDGEFSETALSGSSAFADGDA
jgi:hypothetical protein